MGSKTTLSNKQKNILKFIWEYMSINDSPPTIREIGSATKISSTSVVNYNVTRLIDLGYVMRIPGISRGLRVTDAGVEYLGSGKLNLKTAAVAVKNGAKTLAADLEKTFSQLVRVPILGDIVASEPVEVGSDSFSSYDTEDVVEVASSMLPERTEDLFALKVKGDSMIDAMINEGDIVIMRQQTEARTGDMVAVWLAGDTTTLKYFHPEGEQVRLQPANPTMEPIYVDPQDVTIQGKVVMVVRQTA